MSTKQPIDYAQLAAAIVRQQAAQASAPAPDTSDQDAAAARAAQQAATTARRTSSVAFGGQSENRHGEQRVSFTAPAGMLAAITAALDAAGIAHYVPDAPNGRKPAAATGQLATDKRPAARKQAAGAPRTAADLAKLPGADAATVAAAYAEYTAAVAKLPRQTAKPLATWAASKLATASRPHVMAAASALGLRN